MTMKMNMVNDLKSSIAPIYVAASPASGSYLHAQPLAVRRKLARFDTPRPLSQALVDWAVRAPTDTIFEPSSGSGVFIHSAVHRLRLLKADDPLRNIRACDIDPRACRQTRLDSGLHERQVWNADLMTLASPKGIDGHRFDVIVGNPPFLKLHDMTDEQRETARSAADRLAWPLDRKASLWAYFVIACVRGLTDGGRLSLILPQGALHAGYARDVMHGAARFFKRSMLVSLRETCFASVGTKERTVVFFGDDYQPDGKTATAAALVECANVDAMKTFLAGSTRPRFQQVPRLNGHAVPHLLSTSASSVLHLEDVPHSAALGSFLEVKIGAVTGANDFFILTEAERRQRRLPLSSVMPVIQKFPTDAGLRVSRPLWKRLRDRGDRCWMLYPEQDDARVSVQAYLGTFPAADIEANRTFGKRAHWYRTQLTPPPDAYMKYLSSKGPRLALATFDSQCTNTIHAIYFNAGLTLTQRRMIVLSAMSTFSRLSAEFEGRSYGTDALKLEPSEAKRMRILVPPTVNGRQVARLFSAVHALLANGNEIEATALVDAWLYKTVPGVRTRMPLAKSARLLQQARQRRSFQPVADTQRGR